jgi:hypothetical protein
LLALAMPVVLLACDSTIPPPEVGGRVLGKLTYGGKAVTAMAMQRPALRVAAAVDFPPTGHPHAATVLQQATNYDFASETPFELRGLLPYRYRVFAQIVDLTVPDPDSTALPLGGYPDLCALTSTDRGWIDVTAQAPVVLDTPIRLYDSGGVGDPCMNPTSNVDPLCPAAGSATAKLVVSSTQSATAADRVVLTLAISATAFPPRWYRITPGANVTFPFTVIATNVPPDTYTYLYACLDRGADSGLGLCDPSLDLMSMVELAPPLTIGAGDIVDLAVDLGTNVATIGSVEKAVARGCP